MYLINLFNVFNYLNLFSSLVIVIVLLMIDWYSWNLTVESFTFAITLIFQFPLPYSSIMSIVICRMHLPYPVSMVH